MAPGAADVPHCSQAGTQGEDLGLAPLEDGTQMGLTLQFPGATGREDVVLHGHQTPWMPFGASGSLPNPSFLPLLCKALVCCLLPSVPELAAFLRYSEFWKYFEIFIQ